MRHTLESRRGFALTAWAILLVSAVITLLFALKLKAAGDVLGGKTDHIIKAIDAGAHADFEY